MDFDLMCVRRMRGRFLASQRAAADQERNEKWSRERKRNPIRATDITAAAVAGAINNIGNRELAKQL